MPGVGEVFDVTALPATCPDGEGVAALVCRSVCPGRGGELYVVPARGSFFDAHVVLAKGTSHGSPFLYDRAVPLLVRAPGRVAAGRTLGAPIPFTAFTRTVSALLGL